MRDQELKVPVSCSVLNGGDFLAVELHTAEAIEQSLNGISRPLPTTGDLWRAAEPCGQVSVLLFDDDVGYGRILGEVMLDKSHINLEMVQDGMAWHYTTYSKSKELAKAEAEARMGKKGLWVDKEQVPPCEFRKTEREKSKK